MSPSPPARYRRSAAAGCARACRGGSGALGGRGVGAAVIEGVVAGARWCAATSGASRGRGEFPGRVALVPSTTRGATSQRRSTGCCDLPCVSRSPPTGSRRAASGRLSSGSTRMSPWARRAASRGAGSPPTAVRHPMRVGLLTTYQQRCGLATYAESLADELRPLGMDVHVLRATARARRRTHGKSNPIGCGTATALATEALAVRAGWSGRAATWCRPRTSTSRCTPRNSSARCSRCSTYANPAVTTLHARSGGDLRRRFVMWRFARVLRWSNVVVHNRAHADELRAAGVARSHVHGMPVDAPSLAKTRDAPSGSRSTIPRARALRLSDAGQGRPGGDARGRRPASVGVSDLRYWISGATSVGQVRPVLRRPRARTSAAAAGGRRPPDRGVRQPRRRVPRDDGG